MAVYDIPDHPIIQNCERTGYPDSKGAIWPHCPVCGEECETLYKDRFGAIVGRDVCIEEWDAWDCPACFDDEKGD